MRYDNDPLRDFCLRLANLRQQLNERREPTRQLTEEGYDRVILERARAGARQQRLAEHIAADLQPHDGAAASPGRPVRPDDRRACADAGEFFGRHADGVQGEDGGVAHRG